jgi:putative cardiolipin synthase
MEVGSRTPPLLFATFPPRAAPVAALLLCALAGIQGCASLPPGAKYEKQASVAYAHPEDTRIAKQFSAAAAAHSGSSAFRIISRGADGFAVRMQLIDRAEHSLDLQYFIYHEDQTGQLITEALLRAADRGVHLRLLVDDGATEPGDGRIRLLAAHPQIEVRIFNPFAYRGNSTVMRGVEYAFNHRRLDFRMHNKLMLIDNASALIGGRNIGDQYFQIDPQGQYADDDVFVYGPTVQKLSESFDSYWNSALAIPVQALSGGAPKAAELAAYRTELSAARQKAQDAGASYLKDAESGAPLAGILDGALPVVWASALVVCDPPDKRHEHAASTRSAFAYEPVAKTVTAVRSELLMITPYFVPTPGESQALKELRQRNVRVGILTNSLESTTEVSAHAGYQRHRTEMLQSGVELHEVRAAPEKSRGSGQSAALSRYGNYGLHAKLYTFDRSKLFIGSMNFDQRSAWLNTEVGLLIDSSELAQQAVARYDAMTQLDNAYEVLLQPDAEGHPRLVWRTRIGERVVETTHEPTRNAWRGLRDDVLELMPIDDEL